MGSKDSRLDSSWDVNCNEGKVGGGGREGRGGGGGDDGGGIVGV